MIQENTIITDGSCKFVVRNIGGGGGTKERLCCAVRRYF